MGDETKKIAPAAAGATAPDLIAGATPFGWFSAASGLLSGVAGGSTPPAVSSASNYSNFNTGGFTVASSGGKATSTPAIPWYVYLLAGVAVIVWIKKK